MFAKKNLDKKFFGLPRIKFFPLIDFSTKWLTPDLNLCFSVPDHLFLEIIVIYEQFNQFDHQLIPEPFQVW